MEYVAYLASTALLVLWLWIILQVVRGVIQPKTLRERLGKVAIALFGLGFASFFSFGAASLLPSSLEWPVGLSGDLHATSSGFRIVGHDPAQRIQIYDANWRFLRAIPIDAHGGMMEITVLPNDQIEVTTARGRRRMVFALDGALISNDAAPSRASRSSRTLSFGPWVPTWPWLWTISNPFCGWILLPFAIVCGIVSGKVKFNAGVRCIPPAPPPGLNVAGRCPACGSPIPPEDINVQSDTALCRACGHATAYSVLVHAPVESVHSAPPEGCDVQRDGQVWCAVASTRHWKFIPLAIFATIWNGLLFVFIVVIASLQSPIALVFLVFLSAHIASGIFIAWNAACLALGRVELVIDGEQLAVSTGFAPLMITRRRKLSEIRGVQQQLNPRSPMSPYVIVVQGARPLRFACPLNDQRRAFVFAALMAELRRRASTPA